MSVYASGAKSLAICDRCGLQYPYQTLQMEWTGLKVCEECWESKHPQLEPRAAADAQAIWQPRPGEHNREDATPRPLGLTIWGRPGEILNIVTTTDAVVTGLQTTSAVGTETALGSVIETGLQATSAVGTESLVATAFATGVYASTAVGDEWGHDLVIETGLSSTTAVGTVSIALSQGWGGETYGKAAWGE